jgi:regulatory protein
MKNENNYQHIYSQSVRYLSHREHSTLELKQKLLLKTDLIDTVNLVIEELIEINYLNDRRFSEVYVRSKVNRGFGPSRIAYALKSKGISSEMATEAIQQSDIDWYALAIKVASKKCTSRKIKHIKERTKIQAFMQYRGFTFDQIQTALNENSP